MVAALCDLWIDRERDFYVPLDSAPRRMISAIERFIAAETPEQTARARNGLTHGCGPRG
jgi:hypothetical protein